MKKALTPLFAIGALQTFGLTAVAEIESRATYPGSYRTHCANIYGTPDFLQADCKSNSGHLRFTRLDQPRLCLGDIRSEDGNLVCDRRKESPPLGSYRRSCRKQRVFQGVLYAECKNEDGSYRSSFLNEYALCTGDISSNNGYLRCD